MNELQIIKKNTNFLSKENWESLKELQVELQDNLNKQVFWRTDTEMRVSVLNDMRHTTNASKYWQATKEQTVFFENLVQLSFEYRKNEVEIKNIERMIKNETDILNLEFLQIQLEELVYKRQQMEFAAKDRTREIKLWSDIKKELNDGSFDDQNVNSHQLVSYTESFINDFNCCNQNTPPADRRNLEGKMLTAVKELIKQNKIHFLKPDYIEFLEKTGLIKKEQKING